MRAYPIRDVLIYELGAKIPAKTDDRAQTTVSRSKMAVAIAYSHHSKVDQTDRSDVKAEDIPVDIWQAGDLNVKHTPLS